MISVQPVASRDNSPPPQERRRSPNQATPHLDNDTSQHVWMAKV